MLKKLLGIDKKILIFGALFAGIVLSVITAKTMAYTDSAVFCKNCHIMTPVYESFMDSTHTKLSCNDCHLPHENMAKKLVFKGKAGMGHVYYNTLGTSKIPNVFHATENSKEVINDNCISCHEKTLENVSHEAKDSCSSCHRQVPHGKGFKDENYKKPPVSGDLLENKGGY
jgi:cytochrome c nitrite reductase small subunit